MHDPLAIVQTLQKLLIDAGLHRDLDLPRIAVVGSQSAGKTSVLQSIVGRDFLPCGVGIVTRRPLILQLRSTAAARTAAARRTSSATCSDGAAEWAEFGHKPDEQFTSFDQVRKEIQLETERLCGDRQGVSDEPILLSIFSPSVTGLTLVDLPGLTKVPTGDQPVDISDRIQKLVLTYIKHKSCIILAVSAANTDLATSDALALAHKVDPHGERTLGVLTKLDLAEEAGSALKALSGKIYNLQLGHVGVVCKSEQASKRGVTFEESLEAEKVFLQQARALRAVADQCGIPHLKHRLHQLLLMHIREALPDLQAQVRGMVDETKLELEPFRDQSLDQCRDPNEFLLHLISGYVHKIVDALDGRLPYNLQEQPSDKLVGGARVRHIFHCIFAQAMLEFDVFHGLTDLAIRVAMRNAAGPKSQLFVPVVAFEMLIKSQISKLKEPSLQCVHLVYDELKNLTLQSEMPEMQPFPALREKLLEVVQTLIKQYLQPTTQHVSNLISIELAHINIDHPDFIGGLRAMHAVHTEHTFQAPLAELEAVLAKLIPRVTSGDGPIKDSVTTDTCGQGSLAEVEPLHRSVLEENVGIASGTEKASLISSPSTTAMTVGQRRDRWGEALRIPTMGKTLQLPPVPLVVMPPSEPSEKEELDTKLLKSLVSSYVDIVKKKLIDAVPKTIMHFLVNAVRDALLHECIAELYCNNLCTTLLTEDPDVRQFRMQLESKLAQLKNILQILSQVRDSSREILPCSPRFTVRYSKPRRV